MKLLAEETLVAVPVWRVMEEQAALCPLTILQTVLLWSCCLLSGRGVGGRATIYRVSKKWYLVEKWP